MIKIEHVEIVTIVVCGVFAILWYCYPGQKYEQLLAISSCVLVIFEYARRRSSSQETVSIVSPQKPVQDLSRLSEVSPQKPAQDLSRLSEPAVETQTKCPPIALSKYLKERHRLSGRFGEVSTKDFEFVGGLFSFRLKVIDVTRLESGIQILGEGYYGHHIIVGCPESLEAAVFALRPGDILELVATGTMIVADFLLFETDNCKRIGTVDDLIPTDADRDVRA